MKHTNVRGNPPKKFEGGDSYGSGVKNKVGKPISQAGLKPISPKKLKKAPKALA